MFHGTLPHCRPGTGLNPNVRAVSAIELVSRTGIESCCDCALVLHNHGTITRVGRYHGAYESIRDRPHDARVPRLRLLLLGGVGYLRRPKSRKAAGRRRGRLTARSSRRVADPSPRRFSAGIRKPRPIAAGRIAPDSHEVVR